jgi:hypothetical protein
VAADETLSFPKYSLEVWFLFNVFACFIDSIEELRRRRSVHPQFSPINFLDLD